MIPPEIERRAREVEHSRKERHEEIKRISITQPNNYRDMTKAEAHYAVTGNKIRPDRPNDREWSEIIKAKNGFHGYVDHPMHFLSGEHGKERINIHKVKHNHHDNFWDVSEYFGGKY